MTTAIQKYSEQKNVEHTIAEHFPKIIWFIVIYLFQQQHQQIRPPFK